MSVFRPADPNASGIHSRTGWNRTLGAIVDHARIDDAVRKTDLRCGDQVIVTTRNSVYSLLALGDDNFFVSGGWFDKADDADPTLITVNGCTYGGSAIRHDIVAAPGLFLEFGNNVSTTRIQNVRVVPGPDADPAHLPC
jgi:hypothetical protein